MTTRKVWKYKLSDIKSFEQDCTRLGASIEAIEDVSILSEPVQAANLRIPNSLAVNPMEGADGLADGSPGPLTYRRYNRFAAGGAGLLWAEAIAVTPEGRANPRQLWLHEGTKDAFADMVRQMRDTAASGMGKEHKPVIVAQLTHSGRYSKPDGVARPLIPQRDVYRDSLVPEQRPSTEKISRVDDSCIVSDDYLDRLQLKYLHAARLAYKAGFDAVDIKSCHGYLVNELLASRNRKGKYGGCFENRTRFILETVDKIKAELGDKIGICLRLGFYDAIPYPYGWGVDKNDYTKPDLEEPVRLLEMLRDKGVRLVNFTIANPYYNPHVGRPFNQPIKGAYAEPEHPLKGVERLIEIAAQIQSKFPDMVLVGTGYSLLRHLMGNVGAAAKASGKIKIIGAGRMAFAYPDFARDIINTGKMDQDKVCVGCSACTQLMRDGQSAGCVVRDNKIYGPIYKRGRNSDRANLARLAESCLQCQDATCVRGCPAGIEIPAFIQAFLDGDDRGAYEIIRRANILPEVCAWLCPVESQCQGGCLQRFIGDDPLPIADIQKYLSHQANKNGWSRLRVPQECTGKTVAVIGAGPAGIAAAAMLIEAGHKVTLIDKNERLGGMIETVIPEERQLDSLKSEMAAVFDNVSPDRLELRLGKPLDEKFNLDDIISEGFDAVFVGLGLPKAISTSGLSFEGLYDALSFLRQAKSAGSIDVMGKRVAVIGGGNTAMDAAVTAKEQGAADVYLIYRRSFEEMPAWEAERNRAMDCGVHFMILTQQLEYLSADNKVTGVKVCPARLAEPDESGRRRPVPVEQSAYILDFDIVVESIGQKSPDKLEAILPGIEIERGLIKTDNYQTSRKNVFAGGDLVHGAATVVAAVADGMKAAGVIDAKLRS
jgi:NADPH-dependent glutamate synthase beta subunit-like oxidoreductase/2,4-dienoyl-CoA reductase-like NADH-dependent reductase (Old Yellow Enzyme family)